MCRAFTFHCSPVHLSRGEHCPCSHVNRAGPVHRSKNIESTEAPVHGTGSWLEIHVHGTGAFRRVCSVNKSIHRMWTSGRLYSESRFFCFFVSHPLNGPEPNGHAGTNKNIRLSVRVCVGGVLRACKVVVCARSCGMSVVTCDRFIEST